MVFLGPRFSGTGFQNFEIFEKLHCPILKKPHQRKLFLISPKSFIRKSFKPKLQQFLSPSSTARNPRETRERNAFPWWIDCSIWWVSLVVISMCSSRQKHRAFNARVNIECHLNGWWQRRKAMKQNDDGNDG